MRMTIRNPTDALEAIKSTPDGLIMWESPVAPDWGDALDGLDVLAVDPGSRNVEGLPAVRKGRDVALFEPPFDAETPVSGREPTARCLQDAVRNVERLVATPRLPPGYSGRAGRGDAAAGTWSVLERAVEILATFEVNPTQRMATRTAGDVRRVDGHRGGARARGVGLSSTTGVVPMRTQLRNTRTIVV